MGEQVNMVGIVNGSRHVRTQLFQLFELAYSSIRLELGSTRARQAKICKQFNQIVSLKLLCDFDWSILFYIVVCARAYAPGLAAIIRSGANVLFALNANDFGARLGARIKYERNNSSPNWIEAQPLCVPSGCMQASDSVFIFMHTFFDLNKLNHVNCSTYLHAISIFCHFHRLCHNAQSVPSPGLDDRAFFHKPLLSPYYHTQSRTTSSFGSLAHPRMHCSVY